MCLHSKTQGKASSLYPSLPAHGHLWTLPSLGHHRETIERRKRSNRKWSLNSKNSQWREGTTEMVKVLSNKKWTGGKTKWEGLILWKQRKSHQRVPCEITRWKEKQRQKGGTRRRVAQEERKAPHWPSDRHCCLWRSRVHLERQVQKPPPSDSGSFGLAQGSGPGGRSKIH